MSKRKIYNIEEWAGKTVGNFTITGNTRTIGTNKTWECQCSCGNIVWKRASEIMLGKYTCCSNCVVISSYENSGPRNHHWKGGRFIPQTYITKLCLNRKSKKLPIDIDVEYLESIWTGYCSLSGLPIAINDTASVDRINSSVGYLKGNVQWVHKVINRMKMDLPEEEFNFFCTAVAQRGKARRGGSCL